MTNFLSFKKVDLKVKIFLSFLLVATMFFANSGRAGLNSQEDFLASEAFLNSSLDKTHRKLKQDIFHDVDLKWAQIYSIDFRRNKSSPGLKYHCPCNVYTYTSTRRRGAVIVVFSSKEKETRNTQLDATCMAIGSTYGNLEECVLLQ